MRRVVVFGRCKNNKYVDAIIKSYFDQVEYIVNSTELMKRLDEHEKALKNNIKSNKKIDILFAEDDIICLKRGNFSYHCVEFSLTNLCSKLHIVYEIMPKKQNFFYNTFKIKNDINTSVQKAIKEHELNKNAIWLM